MGKKQDIEALREKIASLTSSPNPKVPNAIKIESDAGESEADKLKREYEEKLKALQEETKKLKEKQAMEEAQKSKSEESEELEELEESEESEESDKPKKVKEGELTEEESIAFAVEQYQNDGKFRFDLILQLIQLNKNLNQLIERFVK